MIATALPSMSDDIRRQVLTRHCRRSLAAFVQTFWKTIDPEPLRWSWHMQAICDHLQAVSEGRLRHLIICIPPGHAKSLLVSVMWQPWQWIENPGLRELYGSYDEDLTYRDSVRARDIVKSKLYQAMFRPGWNIRRDVDSKGYFANTKGGSRKTYYMRSGKKTGWRGSHVIVDDPLSAEDRNNRAVKAQVIQSWEKVLSTRVNDPATAAFVVIMQRLACLLPGSMIQSDGSVVAIENIKVGDSVVTTQGLQSVQGVASRRHCGKIVGVRVFGHCDTLWVTDDHRILTVDGWKSAGSLTMNDRLVYPIPADSTNLDEVEKLWPTLPEKTAPRKQFKTLTGARNKIDKMELQALVDLGLSSREIAERLGFKSRQLVDNYIALFGICKPGARRVDPWIVRDPGFWRFVGYWLAEGHVGKGRRGSLYTSTLDFSINEADYVNDIRSVFSSWGIPVLEYEKADCGVRRLTICSYQIAGFLSLFGSGATKKGLPEWAVCLPLDLLKELLIGYWRGDGCVSYNSNANGEARITTASLAMANTIQRSFLRLGVLAAVMTGRATERQQSIQGRLVTSRRSYEIRVAAADVPWLGMPGSPRAYPTRNMIRGSTMEVSIKELYAKNYDGLVYDIQTPCHNFLTGSIIAHNCDDLVGHLIEKYGDKWVQLILPTYFDPARRCKTPIFEDPRTEPDELLFPDMFPQHVIDDVEMVLGPVDFAAQHLHQPFPEGGNRFKSEHFQFWEYAGSSILIKLRHRSGVDEFVRIDRLSTFMTIDVASSTDRKADFTSIGLWVITNKAEIILLHRISMQAEEYDVIAAVCGLYDDTRWGKRRPSWVGIEANGPGKPIAQALAARGIPVQEIHISKDKETMSSTAVVRFQAGMIFLPDPSIAPWMHEFVTQLTSFPGAAHDDDVSMVSLAANSVYDGMNPQIAGVHTLPNPQKRDINKTRADLARKGAFGVNNEPRR